MPIRVHDLRQCPISDYLTTILSGRQPRRIRFKGSDRINNLRGSEFILPDIATGDCLCNSSVRVFINGLEYYSGTDQKSLSGEFFITSNSVVINNKKHAGTINIIDRDVIDIYYLLKSEVIIECR